MKTTEVLTPEAVDAMPDAELTPARIAAAGDKELRFYLSPLDGPDFPWVDYDDVLALAKLPEDYVRQLKEQWTRVYPDRMRALKDKTMIVPDACARGLFQWCAHWSWPPAEAMGRIYDEAATDVLLSIYGDLPLSVFRDFVQKASLRGNPVELGRAN